MTRSDSATRLLIVHSAGDFRQAARLREEDGGEIYYGHGYILDELARMAIIFDEVGYLSCAAEPYDDRLPSGARVLGAGSDPYREAGPTLAAIERFNPSHLIVHGPIPALLRWGLDRGIAVGSVLADSFHLDPLRRWWRYRHLPALLNSPGVSLVANHGVNAARNLAELGVSADKILPWDFPHPRSPAAFMPKQVRPGDNHRLLYAGSILRSKGIGELIRAVALLSARRNIELCIAGAGHVKKYRRLVEKLGVGEHVHFIGLIPNAQVRQRMRETDVVVVPSRHAFPEGLPLTLYEALESRTPVVASDHPMFRGHLRHEHSAMIFPAGSASKLASALDRLLNDPALYQRLSEGGLDAWRHMQCPVKWGPMIERWVRAAPSDQAWLADHALTGILGSGVAA